MPEIVQISSVNDFHAVDINDDGFADIISGGNSYTQENPFGRYDASIGDILVNDGKGNLTPLDPVETKLILDQPVRKIASLRTSTGRLLVIVNHNGPMKFYKVNQTNADLAATF